MTALAPIHAYKPSVADRLRTLVARVQFEETDFRHYEAKWRGVYGWLTPTQAAWLFETAKQQEPRGDIVEVGSAYGRSTICLAWGVKLSGNGKVFAVDPHTGGIGFRRQLGDAAESYTSFEGFAANLRRFELDRWVEPRVMTSERAQEQFPERPVRLVFVDGWHNYEAVRQDILGWAKFVVPGGLIAMHDSEVPEVRRAIEDSMAELKIDPAKLRRVDASLTFFAV